MCDILSLYKQKKQRYIQLTNNIIRLSNYRSFRALESNDFIVNDFVLDANTIRILNSMYKQSVFQNHNVNPNLICKCTIINNLINNY